MPRAAELEIVMLGREFVAVQHDRDLAAVAPGAAEHFMLSALAELAQISIGTVRRRHAGIILLDATAHFPDQHFLQACSMAEQAFGVAVFRLAIFADIRGEQRW